MAEPFASAMTLAIDYLRGCGHRRIMLATSSDYLEVPAYRRIENWFEYARSEKYLDRKMEYLIPLGHEHGNLKHLREVLLPALKRCPSDATALICMNHAILMAALSAAWHLKIKIPEDLSLVVIGDTILSDFSQPPITGISVNLEQHMELAMQAIMGHEQHLEPVSKPQLVTPELVRRASVKNLYDHR